MIKGVLSRLSVNRYYKMSQMELEKECAEWHIGEYATQNGRFVRSWAIKQLIEKDKANDSRVAIVISVLALILSIVSLVLKF